MNIGIFGGSFNPIHTGHAILANYIIQNTDIDQLWLMVSPQNPLKDEYNKSYDIHRIRMTEMVSSRLEDVITSGFEFSLPYPSFTINTLDALAAKFPNDSIKLIIGADNWLIFNKWKDYEKIIDQYGLIVYPRNGFDVTIDEKYAGKVTFVDAPVIEISSTYIRQQLKAGNDMSFFLPDDVYRYILKNRLYIK